MFYESTDLTIDSIQIWLYTNPSFPPEFNIEGALDWIWFPKKEFYIVEGLDSPERILFPVT